MGKNGFALFLIFMVLFGVFSIASATPPKILSGFISNALSPLLKWLWSKAIAKTGLTSSQVMKFEGGYIVETVFDGSKLGIEPYSIEVLPDGDLLVLDSVNSNLYKISQPLTQYSRPKLVAGSSGGYSGHVDGRPRDSRMYHPKGLTVDDKGSIYIADTMNMAIRKISDTGVTTIAGGSSSGGAHVDGPSEDAKFSTDFDVVYVGSTCSLLVIDRGNQAIREIQLQVDDCAYQYGAGFPLGIVVLVAAGFFGYMLAMLQRSVGKSVSSLDDLTSKKRNVPSSPYPKPPYSSARPPLIPNGGEEENQEGAFGSMANLFVNAGVSTVEIVRGLVGLRKTPIYKNQQKHLDSWPMQESFVIPDEDEPPSIETRTPNSKKTYAFMANNPDKTHHVSKTRASRNEWDGDLHQQQQHQHYQQHYSSSAQTFYGPGSETTKEIVFGAIGEEHGQNKEVVMKTIDYGTPVYDYPNIRYRADYMGYSNGHY